MNFLENYNKWMQIKESMSLAHETAKISPCLKKKVGCVLIRVRQGKILSTGFGGATDPCKDCVRKTLDWQQDGCWSIHSEVRAVLKLLTSSKGKIKKPEEITAVVTHGPCDQCIKYLHYFGITKIVYDIEYHNDYSKWIDKGMQIYSFDQLKEKLRYAIVS
ncbi:MAG TPA: hypothetical protein DSN98_08335 [Thermoplasmata archaeon]|jgi:dCMP deaminase|nr:MAG TPA: hypothetical protein DSN98_08335 [Thermoplasmata archaeon]